MILTVAELALIGSAFVLGLRHGVDYDHIAAITDITSVQESSRKGIVLSSFYAVGHAIDVGVLGSFAVLLSFEDPGGFDRFMGRAVGLTLVILGLVVVYSLVTARNFKQPLSRGRLILNLYQAAKNKVLMIFRRTSLPSTSTPTY